MALSGRGQTHALKTSFMHRYHLISTSRSQKSEAIAHFLHSAVGVILPFPHGNKRTCAHAPRLALCR